jgi:hypothetical protein
LSNYPEGLTRYNKDPRSPFYDGPDQEDEYEDDSEDQPDDEGFGDDGE